MKNHPKLIAIVGPTATGKSDLAVAVALHLKEAHQIDCEIVSADSRQVYSGLDIGTGKITHAEMKDIPHHMIDIVSPLKIYTVFAYADEAEKIIKQIHERGNMPILCGGTGQYIDAVITGQSGAPVPPDLHLRDSLDAQSSEEVLAHLEKLSQEKKCDISTVDLKNKRRMIRAIEIITSLGYIPTIEKKEQYSTLTIGLDTDSDVLKKRIGKRLQTRIDAGMITESENLLEKGLITHERMQKLGLEYIYTSMLLQNQVTKEEFEEQLYFAIWHYAKRQRTWFKRNTSIVWFDAIKKNLAEKVSKVVDEFLK